MEKSIRKQKFVVVGTLTLEHVQIGGDFFVEDAFPVKFVVSVRSDLFVLNKLTKKTPEDMIRPAPTVCHRNKHIKPQKGTVWSADGLISRSVDKQRLVEKLTC